MLGVRPLTGWPRINWRFHVAVHDAHGGRRRSLASASWHCPATSVAKKLDREHCGGCCPPGLLAIPRSGLSFPTGRAFCPRSASS
jgi:hypothetical protein